MQINHHYHSEHFRNVAAMLDPRQNVDYAARFLARLHARHETWSMAVARYHAGPDNDPAQKRYVCRVIANMVATGFGKWTTNAREFLQLLDAASHGSRDSTCSAACEAALQPAVRALPTSPSPCNQGDFANSQKNGYKK